MSMGANTLLKAVLGAVIGLALYPVITSAVTTINATAGTVEATLLGLVGTIYLIMIVAGVGSFIYFSSKG